MVPAGVLASGGEDRRVCVWDLEKTAAPGAAPEPGLEKRAGRSIPQLVFSHAGHRASVSAHMVMCLQSCCPQSIAECTCDDVLLSRCPQRPAELHM